MATQAPTAGGGGAGGGDTDYVPIVKTALVELRQGSQFLSVNNIKADIAEKYCVGRDKKGNHPCWETFQIQVRAEKDHSMSCTLRDNSGHYVGSDGAASGNPQVILGSTGEHRQFSFTLVDMEAPKVGSVYEIEPRHAPGLRVDIAGAGKSNGTEIRMWDRNGSNAQRFKVLQADGDFYVFEPLCAPGSAIDNRGTSHKPCHLWGSGGCSNENTHFRLEPINGGYFAVIARTHGGHHWDVEGAQATAGGKLSTWGNETSGAPEHRQFKFTLVDVHEGKDSVPTLSLTIAVGGKGSVASQWVVRFIEPPVLSAIPLLGVSTRYLLDATPSDLKVEQPALWSWVVVMRIAHKDVGTFHLSDEPSVDRTVQPFFDAVVDHCNVHSKLEKSEKTLGDVDSEKVNRGLVVVHDNVQDFESVKKGVQSTQHGVLAEPRMRARAEATFEALRDLGAKLLCLLGLAQWDEQLSDYPQWHRGFLTKAPVFALRHLQYRPGPLHDVHNHRIVTTAIHTDATYLTLLVEDDCGGLELKDKDGRWIPVPHRLPNAPPSVLVNTGNVLGDASGGFYQAVCHRVRRTERSAEQCRYSMPFFMDEKGSKTKGC